MITPRILRRSLRSALQWRLLLLWWASLLVPGALAALPVASFLGVNLDHSTRAKQVAWMDGSTLIELSRRLGEPGAASAMGGMLAGASLVVLLLTGPILTGVMVTAARSDEPLPLNRLLAGAGELYGRMLRTLLWGVVPLGVGGGLSALVLKLVGRLNQRAIWETDARAHWRNGLLLSAVLILISHLLVDTARAHFAAEPGRRSALAALWSAAKLLARRPLRVLSVGAAGAAAGLGLPAILMALRLQVDQGGWVRIGLAWALAQAAHLAVGWGRGTRIFALAELARADAADRARPFLLDPPATSPPAPAVRSDTLSVLSPPAPAPRLSPPDGSGT